MSRNAKILIFGSILIYAIYINLDEDNSSSENDYSNNSSDKNGGAVLDDPIITNTEKEIKYYSTPENGFSPYDSYFGKGIYDNSTRNSFIIENSNSTDAVVLLVNAYSNKKIRNEFVRKSETLSMTSVPNGTYYLRWLSGNNWHPDVMIGNLKGGFQTDVSASQSNDRDDWMKSSGLTKWTITLYSVSDGNMDTESIELNSFSN